MKSKKISIFIKLSKEFKTVPVSGPQITLFLALPLQPITSDNCIPAWCGSAVYLLLARLEHLVTLLKCDTTFGDACDGTF